MSEEVKISVRSLAGGCVWGPEVVHASCTIADLQVRVATVVKKPAIMVELIYGGAKMRAESSLKDEGITDGSEIQLIACSSGSVAEQGLKAFDFFVEDNPELWQQASAPFVYECLCALPFFDDAEGRSIELVIKCLSQEVKDVYDHRENYPDKLTWKAAQLLPLFAKPGDARVQWLCNQWLIRLVNEDMEVTTSEVTLDAMLKVIPHVVSGDLECTRTLIGQVTEFLDHGGQWNYSKAIVACWEALLRLVNPNDPQSVSVVRDHILHLYGWIPKTIHEEDEKVWNALVDIAWVIGMEGHEWFTGTGPRVPERAPLWPKNQRDPDMFMINPMENEWWPGQETDQQILE